jgi:hypothetical protein
MHDIRENTMFVIFKAHDEVIVTTLVREEATYEEYFGEDMGRDLDDYDRIEVNDPAVVVTPEIDAF